MVGLSIKFQEWTLDAENMSSEFFLKTCQNMSCILDPTMLRVITYYMIERDKLKMSLHGLIIVL